MLTFKQFLKEEKYPEIVKPLFISDMIEDIHRRHMDFEDGNINDRIYWFDEYQKKNIKLDIIKLHEWDIDQNLVNKIIKQIKESPNTIPPIVFDPFERSIIDGIHRANAYNELGLKEISAYVGSKKSSSYGEFSEDD